MTEVYRKHIEWQPASEQQVLPLGRSVLHDPRSRNFTAAQAKTIRDVMHESHALPLTQVRGSCTAEALCGALDTDPDYSGTTYDQARAEQLYDAEIVLEGGDPAQDDPGGTGVFVCKAARGLGWIDRYEHAFGLDHALKALTLRPIIVGINWYSTFDTPDKTTGVVMIGDGAWIRGGHEIVAVGVEVEKQIVWFYNSWGEDWGLQGRFCMSWETLARLLSEEGDCTVPIIRRTSSPAIAV